MEWNANLLPDDATKWTSNSAASVTGALITLDANGRAATPILREDIDYLPDFLQVTITFRTGQALSHYEPHFYCRLLCVDSLDNRYLYTAVMNQYEQRGQDTWFVQTAIDIDDIDIKYIEFSVYADDTITESIYITQRELRTSVALSKSEQDAINNQLPSVIQFSNSTEVTVTTALTTVITVNFQTSASTNLLLHLILNGYASSDCDVTISFQLNSNELQYTPMMTKVFQGNFLLGIPGSVLQVPEGNNVFVIMMSCSSGTLTFNRDHIWGTLDGKNILGGYSSEVPHAEIIQTIPFIDLLGNRLIETFYEVSFETPTAANLSSTIPFLNMTSIGTVADLVSIAVVKVAVQERFRDDGTTVQYDHDEYIVLDNNMQFKNPVISKDFTVLEFVDNATIYEVDIDSSSVQNYESFAITPRETTLSTYVEEFDPSDYESDTPFIQVVIGGVRLQTMEVLTFDTLEPIQGGQVAELAIDATDYKEIITIR